MKNFTLNLIATSLVMMVAFNAYSQDVFKTANVGIGTTTPQQKLDVAGNIKFSGALMPNGAAGTTGNILLSQGAGTWPIWLANGTSGQVLSANGSGIPTWTTLSLAAGWALTGNTGTVPGTNFVGTLDDQSLEFEVNGHNAGSVDPLNNNYSAANVYMGSYGTIGVTPYGSAGNNDAGNGNIGIGISALGSAGGPSYVGNGILYGSSTTTGYNGAQVAVGAFALASDVYGAADVALGAYAQFHENFFTGTFVQNSNTYGYNTSAGAYSLYSNSTGQYNSAIGYNSMYGSGSATAVGFYNTALGYNALYTAGVGEASNTAIGSNALYYTTASRNTGVGDSTLYTNTTGTNNTALGYQANVGGANLTNATAIGYQATAPVSNSITLGNSSASALYLPGYSAVGDILYTSANTGLVGALTPGAAGTILQSNGTASIPTWVSAAGINSVSGTPPIYSTGGATPLVSIQGSTSGTDAGGVLYSLGAGTSALFTPTGTVGYILQSNGTSAPTWVNASSTGSWNLLGNPSTTSANFLGPTTSGEPLLFRVNGVQAGAIDYTDQCVALGYGAYSEGGTIFDNGTSWVGGGSTTIGFEAAYNCTAGTNGTFVGTYALYSCTTPGAAAVDVAVGYATQYYGTQNGIIQNVSVGAYSLYSNAAGAAVAGESETAIGYKSMYGTGTSSGYFGSYNAAIGYQSLYDATGAAYVGASNTAIGSNALVSTTGARNTAAGDSALATNISGANNTALGYQANVASASLTNATAIGYQATAPASNSVTLGNTTATALYLPGYSAVGNLLYTSAASGLVAGLTPGAAGTILQSTGTASAPTWVPGGGINSVTGTPPIYSTGGTTPAISIQGSTSGTDLGGVLYSTGSGTSAIFTPTGTSGYLLQSNGASAPTWVAAATTGTWALTGNNIVSGNFLGTTDNQSLVFEVGGKQGGRIDPEASAASNVYLGSWGVLGATTYGVAGNGDGGTVNVGIGVSALGNYTSATSEGANTAIGAFAFPNSTGGDGDVALGAYSQFDAAYTSASVGFSVAVGAYSLYSNTTGNFETAVGYQSMYGSGSPTVYGNYNVALGYNSLYSIGTGGSNTALGSNALYNTTAGRNTAVGDSALYSNISGEFNTALGYQANVGSGAATNLTNATAIGYQSTAPASNSIALGNASATALYLPGYISVGDLLYTSANTGLVSALTPGAAGSVLASSGAGVTPTWVTTSGVNSVIGTPPIYSTGGLTPTVSIQGTNTGTDAGGVLYSQGSGLSAQFTSTGTANFILQSNGTAAPSWVPNAAVSGAWLTTGNTISTTYGTNYLGTVSSGEGFEFKTAGNYAGYLDPNASNIYLGQGTGGDSTVLNTASSGQNVAIGWEAFATLPTATAASDVTAIGAGALHFDVVGNNDAVGAYAMHNLTTGTPDEAFGYAAGFNMTTATFNVSLGFEANYNQTTGSFNTAAGDSALYGGGGTGGTPATYTASYNTAVGVSALAAIGTGVALGTGGSYNTAVGYEAAMHTTTGSYNVALGYQAGYLNTTGIENTLLGYQANVVSGALTNATAIGYQATAPVSNSITLGNASASVLYLPGYSSIGEIFYTSAATGQVAALIPGAAGTFLQSNGTASAPTWVSGPALASWQLTGNTISSAYGVNYIGLTATSHPIEFEANSVYQGMIDPQASNYYFGQGTGSDSLAYLTTGSQNVAMGYEAFVSGAGASQVAAIGAEALHFDQASDNDAVGAFALHYLTTGTPNDAFGYAAGFNMTTGGNNVAIGFEAAYYNTSGTSNVAVGDSSMFGGYPASGVSAGALYSSSYNTAIGVSALAETQTNGNYNVAAGYEAEEKNTTGINNTGVGYRASYNTSTGINNTGVGYSAGLNNTTGSNNVNVGYLAGELNSTGNSNTTLGSNASISTTTGRNTAVGDSALATNTVGFYNTALGYQANVSANNLTNATVIGYQASAPASNSITLGNTSATALYLPGYSAVGNIFYTSATSGLVSALAPGTAGYVLESTGPSSAPAWTSVAGLNSVTCTFPIFNTGTPTVPVIAIQGTVSGTDAGGVLYSKGAGVPAAFNATGTTGYVLQSNGASAPTWVALAATSAWDLTGNAATVPGTNFVGTTGASNLLFKVNGVVAGSIDQSTTNGNAYFGYGVGRNGAVTGNGGSGDYGTNNTAMGTEAMGNIPASAAVTGSDAIGAFAMYNAQAANGNVAIGEYSQYYNGAVQNTSVGAYSLYNNAGTTGLNETALGYYSMYGGVSNAIIGTNNTAIGAYSLYDVAGGGANTAVGTYSLYNSAGGRNTAVGDSALYSNTGGEWNTAVGYQALSATATATGNTGGNYVTALGYNANVAVNSLTNATAIGANAYAAQSNTVVLGAINGQNGYGGSFAAGTGVSVCIGTNTPATDAALAIATGHLETKAASTATSVAAQSAAGTSATSSLTGTDVGGNVQWVEGSGATSGAQIIVTFATHYITAPTVIITPANITTGGIISTLQPYISASSSTSFTISFAAGSPANGVTYNFNYFVIETQ